MVVVAFGVGFDGNGNLFGHEKDRNGCDAIAVFWVVSGYWLSIRIFMACAKDLCSILAIKSMAFPCVLSA